MKLENLEIAKEIIHAIEAEQRRLSKTKSAKKLAFIENGIVAIFDIKEFGTDIDMVVSEAQRSIMAILNARIEVLKRELSEL